MDFTSENLKERMDFVDLWSKYVLEHDDRNWSKQQNIIINSSLKTTRMTKKQYLLMMGDATKTTPKGTPNNRAQPEVRVTKTKPGGRAPRAR